MKLLVVLALQAILISAAQLGINIHLPSGFVLPLQVRDDDRVFSVKRAIQSKEDISVDDQILVFHNIELLDSKTLSYYKIQDGSALILEVEN